MVSDRRITDIISDNDRPSREERIAAARGVVYDEDGDLIDETELEDAIEAYGVDVGVNEEELPEYRNVPRELSLSAVHLAIDTREDPAEFVTDLDEVVHSSE